MTRTPTPSPWHHGGTTPSQDNSDRGGDRTHDLRIKRTPVANSAPRNVRPLLHLHGRAESATTPKAHPKGGAGGTTVAPPARRRSTQALPAPAEAFKLIRPQHGARYRVVTDDDQVLDRVRYDANARAFVVESTPARRQVPLARVILAAKRHFARCGGEVFARVRTWEDEPGGAA